MEEEYVHWIQPEPKTKFSNSEYTFKFGLSFVCREGQEVVPDCIHFALVETLMKVSKENNFSVFIIDSAAEEMK